MFNPELQWVFNPNGGWIFSLICILLYFCGGLRFHFFLHYCWCLVRFLKTCCYSCTHAYTHTLILFHYLVLSLLFLRFLLLVSVSLYLMLCPSLAIFCITALFHYNVISVDRVNTYTFVVIFLKRDLQKKLLFRIDKKDYNPDDSDRVTLPHLSLLFSRRLLPSNC